MWFGNLVTMKWWDDLWLNESFADWLAGDIVAQVYPHMKTRLWAVNVLQYTMLEDARPSAVSLRAPVTVANQALANIYLAYDKGSTVIGLVEAWLGRETFRRGLLEFLNEHAWKNAEAADLIAALSKASGKDVGRVLRGFTDQPGLPLVEISIDDAGIATFRQRRFSTGATRAQLWAIPMLIKYHDGTALKSATLLIDSPSTTLDVGAGTRWILPNADAKGYYRWNLPPEMMAEIAAGGEDFMTPVERAAFVGNLTALTAAGNVRGDEFLRAMTELADDPEPQVLISVLVALHSMRGPLIADEASGGFAAFVRHALQPVADRIGSAPKPEEDETLASARETLLLWLAQHGKDERVIRYGVELADNYLANRSSVDPSLVAFALRTKAMSGNRAVLDQFKRKFEAAADPIERRQLLFAFGFFNDPALQLEILDYMLTEAVRPDEIYTPVYFLGMNSEDSKDRVFEWITSNYAAFTKRIPSSFHSEMPLFADGCSAERLAKARTFFSDPSHRVDGTEAGMTKLSDQITECVTIRQRESARVREYLASFTSAER